jgi:hypothetical protein
MKKPDTFCPNYLGCQIINIDGFVADELQKRSYILNYCESDERNWEQCKRYITKLQLHLCPDFILPDSPYRINEIIDKLENS